MTASAALIAEAARVKAAVSIVAVIGQSIDLKRQGKVWTGLCPFHGERTPSFCVWPDHYHCFGCGAHGDVFTWLMQSQGIAFAEAVQHLGGGGAQPKPARRSPRLAPTGDQHTVELARRIWCEASDPRGTAAEAYLRQRGVSLPDEPVIRWHPRCPCDHATCPAMVALMTDPVTGEPTGIHRTFIRADGTGKAAVDRPKMMLGHAGVVRLAEPLGEGLGLAEGVETALSCVQAIGWGPVWAAASAGGIERFPILGGHALTIFADGDGAGLKAARACARRWAAAGRECLIHIPPPGEDWNDAARRVAA